MPPIAAIEAAAIRNNFRFKERRLRMLSIDLFGTRIISRPHRSAIKRLPNDETQFVKLIATSDSEIDQLHCGIAARLINDQIPGLDLPVQNSMLVNKCDSITRLGKQRDSLVDRQPLILTKFSDRLSVHKFHGIERIAIS